MSDIVILSAARTPIGAFQGALRDLTAPKLGARAIQAAIERAGLTPGDVEQVNMGCVLTAGVGQAPARSGGLPRMCSSQTLARRASRITPARSSRPRMASAGEPGGISTVTSAVE